MRKQPVTISIAPSRLSRLLAAVLAGAVVTLAACYGPPWLALLAAPGLAAGLWLEWRRADARQLRWVPGPGRGWQQYRAGHWETVRVASFYLGPWLLGVRIGGRRCWVWPDSTDARQRWQLRRLLLWAPDQA
ncbi:hypothetical protein [Modicisalibacter sp. 'Wilcox']|uniref:hypothetical protein n=1 Tax=Modicisalibacter sp. 'Wilcox' TaxID=2679914 RepID=UPI0013D689B5|nr:hypothetical protein [Modicisalibacter sp. 'Wilcox']